MKKNYIYGAAVALTLMVTGCSDDQMVQLQEPATQGHQVRVTASMGTDSRLAITDTGNRLEYAWEATDAFHVFDPANNQTTTFVMDTEKSDENSPMATFVGTPAIKYTEGNKLYAVYNVQQDSLELDANGNVLLDISKQNGQLNDQFQFLFAESTYSEQEETSFFFRHLVTTMKVNITVPEGVTSLKEINFKCNGLPTQATLLLDKPLYDSYNQFVPGDLVSCYNYNDTQTSQLTVTGEFVPVDGVVTVYLYAFPVKQYYENHDRYNEPYIEPAIWMTDDQGVDYVGLAAFGGKTIEAGKTYQLNTEVAVLEPFANEETAKGKGPYEIATAGQLYTFMLRSSTGMFNPDGFCYTNCNYVLTNDIKLNNEMVWNSTNYYESTFDGQGHTISGNVQIKKQHSTGLFRYMSECTVQNLTLDLNVSYDTDEYNEEWFGLLAGEIWNTKIINCINKSDVSGHFWRMGGLIGYMDWNSSMVACGNTGDLNALGECRQMGGIVAEMQNNNVTLEACYNSGLLSVNTVYWNGLQVGGIVGSSFASESNVRSCWANTSLTIENVIYDDHFVNDNNNIFFGGMVGYIENNTALTDCYWTEAIETATGYQSENVKVTGGGTFTGTVPSAEQIAVMNSSMTNVDWLFKEDGTLKVNDNTSLPSWGKENFGNN